MTDELRIVLPWACLVPDNHKYSVIKGRIYLSERYRKAKAQASIVAMGQVRTRPAFTEPVQLEAAIYFPDTARKRDAGNYRKLVTDALEGIAYPDDSLIHRECWSNAGTDAQNPRCEITIRPIGAV